MDPPPPKKPRLQGSSSKPEPMDADPPESSVKPMEADICLEEERMEVNPPPSRQGRHPNIMSAWRCCYIHRQRTRGYSVPINIRTYITPSVYQKNTLKKCLMNV